MSKLPANNPRIPEGINASEENPLREFFTLAVGVACALVAAILILAGLARLLAPYVPFRWEQALSPLVIEYFAQEIEAEMDPAAQSALDQLGRSLLPGAALVQAGGADGGRGVTEDDFRFHLVDMGDPNAFATLGGHIVITTALLQQVASENGLAMVIAHEIAHIQLRHPIEAAGRGVVIQLALAALLGSTDNTLLGSAVNTGGALTVLNFDREMELAADARALAILRQHYGHVGGADEFFRSMEGDSAAERWLEFARTHPSTNRRLQQIREAMAQDEVVSSLRPLPADLTAGPGEEAVEAVTSP